MSKLRVNSVASPAVQVARPAADAFPVETPRDLFEPSRPDAAPVPTWESLWNGSQPLPPGDCREGQGAARGISPLPTSRLQQPAALPTPQPAVPLPGGGRVDVETLPAQTSLFRNRDGWIGGDGDYSVPLSADRTLWLFGDSLVGAVQGDARASDSLLVNNSMAVQQGKDPAAATLSYFWGRGTDGAGQALLAPEDGKGWFWPYHGARTGRGLALFLIQVDRDGASALGFRGVGLSLALVENPDDPPERWRTTQKKIPWSDFSPAGDTFFGSAALRKDGFLYVYGAQDETRAGMRHKHMVLARVPDDAVDDFARWQFYDGREWQSDFRKTARLAPDVANEYSVAFQEGIGRYVAVYSENGTSEKICVRTAPRPEGPWSDAVAVYTCPEKSWGDDILIYSAKGHPALSTDPHELPVSYIANSMDFGRLLADARLYQPQFLRLRFEPDPKP